MRTSLCALLFPLTFSIACDTARSSKVDSGLVTDAVDPADHGSTTRRRDGGEPRCGPLPSCNWCWGELRVDARGCGVGYTCANGVDPCSIEPCNGDDDCSADQFCRDMLCWPQGASCGSYLCKAGEYCSETEQWLCVPPEDGACESQCQLVGNCCICTQARCKALPADCSACACLAAPSGCSCSDAPVPHLRCSEP